MRAVELIQRAIEQVYKDIEMTRTHADNYEQMSREHRQKVAELEREKAELIESLNKLKG